VLLDHTNPADGRTTSPDSPGPTPDSPGPTPDSPEPTPDSPEQDVAELRLVCLTRVGDGYVIRASGRLAARARSRSHVDITFGDAIGGCASELETAVRHIQRWCEEGATVSLLDSGSRLTLRSQDGTAVPLPRSA
jgi:hypothetical protein